MVVEGASCVMVTVDTGMFGSAYTWKQRARRSPRLHLPALYVYVFPAGTRLEYIEVLSIEHRRVRTADIMDSWDLFPDIIRLFVSQLE